MEVEREAVRDRREKDREEGRDRDTSGPGRRYREVEIDYRERGRERLLEKNEKVTIKALAATLESGIWLAI